MSQRVVVERHADVLVLLIEHPPVNALTGFIARALTQNLSNIEPAVRSIVISTRGRTFVAGADIAALEQAAWNDPPTAIDLQPVLNVVEATSLPVVMALHGTVLGGGLELAMAGHYRIAHENARLGQPEVQLGLIPGAGGTQRLPRLIGAKASLAMCVSGQSVTATEALASGLVDEVIADDADVIEAAIARASQRAAARVIGPRTSERAVRVDADDWGMFDEYRRRTHATRPGEIAPLKVIDAVEAAARLQFAEGCRRERLLFVECVGSAQAKALMHLFFAERLFARDRGAGRTTQDIHRAVMSESDAECLRRLSARTSADQSDDRRLYALIEEGTQLLQEGLARRASDLDVLCVRHLSFPRWRGGPLLQADLVGPLAVLEHVRALRVECGRREPVPPLLETLAAQGKRFRDLDRDGG